ncbi:ABC transporter ATP-binding protein [Roseburia hominis]
MAENSKNHLQEAMLEIKNLRVLFPVHKKWLPAVDGVSLSIRQGEITGVVGESGSGKSVMSQSILRLRDHDTAVRYEGEILFENQDLLKRPLSEMRDIRGDRISIIFQDPLNSLSPVHTVEKQLSEILILHKKVSRQQAKERAIEMLKLTGIPNPENCMKKYPFELSGGMQQRVMIAMALACEPRLLIADEPTTALDVTIQEQILHLIRDLNERLGMSVLFITHDMGAVSQLCHSVKVMYLGQVVEDAETEELFARPLHPYTKGLLACIPHLGVKRGQDLPTISGSVPSLSKIPKGCHFCTRCSEADERCRECQPPLVEAVPGHFVKCWKYAKECQQEKEV